MGLYKYHKNNGYDYLTFNALDKYSDKVRACYSVGGKWNFRSRINGVNITDVSEVISNYRTLCSKIHLNYKNVVRINQTHSYNVICIERKINEDEPDINLDNYNDVDGIITNKTDIVLSVTNADCNLVLFYDKTKNVIGAVHAGWRGTINGICREVISKMKSEFECSAKDIICVFMPSIRVCHYEVSYDMYLKFGETFPYLNCGNIYNDKYYLDLPLINKELLKREGVLGDNIYDCNICSYCNHDIIHSYRIEGANYKTEALVIGLI